MTLEELYRVLRSGHVQAQGIVDTLREPLVVLDKDLVVIAANPGFFNVFQTDRDATLGQSFFDLGNGQWQIPDLVGLLEQVLPKSAAVVGYRVEHEFPNLGQRTMAVTARRLVHPDSNSTQILVVFEDVTEHDRELEARDILIAETRHRVKNLLATVRAVARQTSPNGLSGAEYRTIVLGRIEAVLDAQEFITVDGARSDLAALIRQVLKAQAKSDAFVIEGPPVAIEGHLVLSLSTIVHELTTNASKYGALSNGSGRINLRWETEPAEEGRILHMVWCEEGGPRVSPPSRKGFGTELIEYSCKAEGGEARRHFDPQGLRVEIRLPL